MRGCKLSGLGCREFDSRAWRADAAAKEVLVDSTAKLVENI